ncbi:mitochondrial glycoprotein [Panus rudis PR-1116 ss-1]|nr:mitochondrial glycoprotein [Panus rudis PR-1116 ss-1]
MSAIRALRQLTASSSRALAARQVGRAAPRTAALALRASAAVPARNFSVSARRFGEGASDIALTQKLAEELQYEKEAATEGEPNFLKSFKAQNVWQLEDTPGNDEVTLTRKFGNENIRLMFSIADVQAEQENEFDENEEQEEPANPSYPIRCSFSITKDSAPGALTIDAMAQDGAFIVDNISFYSDSKVGTELTAEADWKRRGLYIGPQFDTLDITVQEEFEKFIQERGINENLAMFIPEYAEYKEQKEYVRWLGDVKKFIEA